MNKNIEKLSKTANAKLEHIQKLLEKLMENSIEELENKESELKLFASFKENSKNLELLQDIKKDLYKYRIHLYISKDNIPPGGLWQSDISQNLSSCHAGIILHTEDYIDSSFCSQEAGWMLGRKIPLLCITNNGDPASGFLRDYQSLELNNKSWVIADKIIDWVHGHNSIKRFYVNSLLNALENSVKDWYVRDPIWDKLEKISTLTNEDIDHIIYISEKSKNFLGGEYRGNRYPRQNFSSVFDRQIDEWKSNK